MRTYCPKCHRETYTLTEEGDKIKVSQNGKTIINLGAKSKVTMNLSCPHGHPVELRIGEEDASSQDNATR